MSVSPRRDREGPYRFRVSGQLILPKGTARAQACGRGTVTVSAKAGSRVLVRKVAPLDSKCRFGLRVKIRERQVGDPRTVLLAARFNGNRALVPAAAKRRARVG
jgi:hypothetical protein